MRHHIIVKFIAIFLAALTLLTALGSGFGIIAMTALGLYEGTVDELYDEQMESTRRNFAVNLIHRYASLELGNLPEQYLNNYFGHSWQYNTFQYGYYFYNILDENGNIVESTTQDMPGGAKVYTIEVTEVMFRHVLENVSWIGLETEPFATEEGYDVTPPTTEPESTASDPTAAPDASSVPTEVPSTTDPTDTVLTVTEPDAQAETPSDPTSEPAQADEPTQVPATTEAPAPTEAEMPMEANEPAMANAPTENIIASIEETSAAATIPDEIQIDGYFDYETQEYVEFAYFYDELPPYTVELYLLPGALPEEHLWSLLEYVWQYRVELFYVLGVSLFLFAVFAVYLCCAAGKKPGREEIKAGGFNCIPLDLYGLCGGLIIFFALFMGYEVVEYLLRSSPNVLVPFVVIAGYGCSLIIVGFCFACAAQFKTPGHYWIRNSIVGRCFILLIKGWNLLMDGCAKLAEISPPIIKRIFRWLGKCAVWIYQLTARVALAVWEKIRKVCLWAGKKLVRFYSLLPHTWQWLLTGMLLIFIFLLSLESGSLTLLWLGIFLAVCIILYGAHCFGILLEATRRMSKGDLETKVSDQFLIGSFKDFAKELNALADVAVIAAQKQMKSERMKTELITNVSHDIKTPLTSIINYVDLLQKPHSEEDQEIYLEVLSRQSLQLKKLIDDLMEMSKASTGNMAVDVASVNAGEAINQALGEFSDKLDKAQLIPVFRQPDEPIYMQADGRLVWRVMSNLLSNAVKYALPGTRVYIDLMELDGKVIISLKNISREELNVSADELLERFVRGDASRNTEGSGLGLNIAKSLMEIQKGQLQLLVDGDLFKVTLVFPAA